MDHLKIGLIIYGSLDTISGGYLYDREMVRYLESQGDSVEIISLPWRSYGRHLGDNFSVHLRRRLADANFDVLIQDELNHPSLLGVNRLLARRRPYPVISLVHHLRCSEQHPALTNRLHSWIERRYLRSVDGFIFNSRTTQATVEALVGPSTNNSANMRSSRVRDLAGLSKIFPGRPAGSWTRLERKNSVRPSVVAYPAGDHRPTAVTPAEIDRRAHEPGPLRILFVGNLIPRKGLHTLLTALAALPQKIWQLDVVGGVDPDDGYTKSIFAQIRAAGIGDRVQLLGTLGNPDLPDLLARSQVLAVPSQYEGFGIVYLEALAAGLPVIASTAGAAHEIVTPGETGFLVAPGDGPAITAALTALHADRDLLARMGHAAQARYALHPTWADTGARIREFLADPRIYTNLH
ncbi:MAG: glycosyltransferase family 4 protein [Caldilineaceae bacterium]|nr:glycosyltransferase family 4 protein [Caldilineaceae bacterium]MBP8108844.1 glycosyltransferase family 4 protein [Caldilineaceae bacterium]MBP9072209.1 glycosyltransferase family 4 protein [Caldilineaceae bacterium]